MRTFKTTLAIFAAFALMGSGVVLAADHENQNDAMDSASASVEIIDPIAIAQQEDLHFGQVVASGAGSVTISPAGARSVSGDVTLGIDTDVQEAVFEVSGQSGNGYSIALPASLVISDGSTNMTVEDFTSNPAGANGVLTGGSETLRVGAKLVVAGTEDPGPYSGSFDVTVYYN